MTIQARTLRKFWKAALPFALVAVACDCWEPTGGLGHALHAIGLPFILCLGCVPVNLAYFEHLGLVQVFYSEGDRQRLRYRAVRRLAATEFGLRLPFASRYYQTYGLDHAIGTSKGGAGA
jgi:hypothetical protein